MSALNRFIVFFVVLIAFVGLWSFFGQSGGLWQAWVPFVTVFGAIFGYLRYEKRRYAPAQQGQRLSLQGRYAQAVGLFEQYRNANPKDALGAYNLGAMRLLLWRLESAKSEFEASEKLTKGKPGSLVAVLPEHLALTHALLGNAGDARRLLTVTPPEKADPGRTGLVEGILLARDGKWAEARNKLGTFEVKQMAGIGPFIRALDAFCIEQLTGERRHVDRLALFADSSPEELRKYWPELVAFVERAPAW